MAAVTLHASLLLSLAYAVLGCSMSSDWVESTPAQQWAAAQNVAYGRAADVVTCSQGEVQSTGPLPAGASNTACGQDDWWSLVLVDDLTLSKGTFNCSRLLVSGFTDSSACGVDPPAVGQYGTFFMCSVEGDEEDVCTAALNTEGNAHIGFTSGTVQDSPGSCGPDDGTCRSLDACTGRGASARSSRVAIPACALLLALISAVL